MVDIQSPTAEIRRGKTKEEEGKKLQDENILHRATINNHASGTPKCHNSK